MQCSGLSVVRLLFPIQGIVLHVSSVRFPVLLVGTNAFTPDVLQSLLDALRAQKDKFIFQELELTLRPTAMLCITLNPEHPGRAELPQSVKVG